MWINVLDFTERRVECNDEISRLSIIVYYVCEVDLTVSKKAVKGDNRFSKDADKICIKCHLLPHLAAKLKLKYLQYDGNFCNYSVAVY